MMISVHYISIALLLVLNQYVAGSKDTIDTEPLDDKSLVDQLCDKNFSKNKIISRISTITKLHGQFESLSDTSKADCRNLYLEPLAHLRDVVYAGSESVCSLESLMQIDQFHWFYIVGGLSRRWRKAAKATLPEPIKTFFMNYAHEVTEKCKDTLKDRLALAAGKTNTLAESLYTHKFGFIINEMSNILNPQTSIKKHDDFLLLWDYLVDKETLKGRSVERKIDQATGELVLMSFKVKKPEGAWMIQQKCREEMRPVYKDTVLPVMRLISIGYGNKEKKSRNDVAGSELVKNWYSITQLCQLILPIHFFLDKSLKQEQMTLLTMDEVRNSPATQENLRKVQENQAISRIELKPVRLDDVLANAAGTQMAKMVKSNIKARNSIYRKVFKNVLKSTNSQLKKTVKNLFVSKKVGENKFAIEPITKDQITGQVKALAENDDDDDNERKPRSLTRHKRGFFKTLIILACFGIGAVVLIYMLYATILHLIWWLG